MTDQPQQSGLSRIGLISDTHGHLPKAIGSIFKGLDLIVHAGDIDNPKVLEVLCELGPVVAVRGNMDGGPWAGNLHPAEMVEINDRYLYVLHNIDQLDLVPESIGIAAVVSGHTHRPEVRQKNGVWYINPGSAVFPRNGYDPSVAVLHMAPEAIEVKHIGF